MKRFIQLFALVGCMLFLATTTMTAQDKVRNSTNCDMWVRVGYGPVGSCTTTGFADAIVPAGTSIAVGIPAGTEVIKAKGIYNGIGCPFYVGLPCTIYSLTTFVPCSNVPCGDYKVRLYPGIGIWIYD